MKLSCPHCGATITATNVNIQQMVAICDDCHHLFKFEAPAAPRLKSGSVPQPEAIQVDWTDEAFVLRLRWSWHTQKKYLLTLMSGWLLVALFLMGSALGDGDFGRILVAVLLGALPTYYFAMLANNTLRVYADGDTLRVWDAPLPWVHNVEVELSAIEDLEVVTSYYSDPSAAHPYYDVQARVRDGRARRLVEFVPEQHALYVEQQLRNYLARMYANNEDATLRLAYNGDENFHGHYGDAAKHASKR